MKADINPLVVDASVSLAWCFEEEKTPYTESVLDHAARGAELIVPPVWLLEMTNVLLIAERRKRLTASQADLFLDQLEHFNISVDVPSISRAFGRFFDEARQWHLSSYDASYLELAMRRGAPLATLDVDLKRAARIAGVTTSF